MRCREAKQWLCVQRDGDIPVAEAEAAALQDHLDNCPECRALERRLRRLDGVFRPSISPMQSRISTDNIMLAIQQRKRIAEQLEHIRCQQRTRVARMRGVGTACIAIVFFTLSSIPLLLLAAAITQSDLVVDALSLLNGVIDVLFVLGQYLQEGLTLVTRNNWLLSAFAFAVVIMMGMWLRLMRHPQEA